jgi:hypothetical protein
MPKDSYAAAKDFAAQLDRLIVSAKKSGAHISEIANILV